MYLLNMDHPFFGNPTDPEEAQASQTILQNCQIMTVNINSLIAEVEARQVLWDRSNLYFADRNMRRAAWQEVYKALSPNFEQLPKIQQVLLGSAIERRWRSLRDGFSKKLRSELQITQSRRSPYVYHQQLNFLRKVIIPRSNANTDEDNPDSQFPRRTQLEEKLAHFLEMHSQVVRDDHYNFFDSLLPLVRKFDEQQIIGFRTQVLNLIQDIRVSSGQSIGLNIHNKSADSIGNGFQDNYQQQNCAPSYCNEASLGAEQSAYVSQGPSSTSDSGIDSPVCESSLIGSAVCAALNMHQNPEM